MGVIQDTGGGIQGTDEKDTRCKWEGQRIQGEKGPNEKHAMGGGKWLAGGNREQGIRAATQ